jgi:cation transport ATPase
MWLGPPAAVIWPGWPAELWGAAFSLWTMLASLRRGRLGVDVIALLALVGALAVGEYLAAAVISVMVASGQSLEAWAAGRARRDLHALLQRAPRLAHRYKAPPWSRSRWRLSDRLI